MSQKTSEFEPAIRRFERQAAESIHEDTDLLTVVRAFDFNEVPVYKANEPEWTARYDYEPMVRAFYCKELAGLTTKELHEYLADAERAGTLGFDPDHFAPDKTAPGRTTLGRAWRTRFSDQLKTFVQTSAERILGVAHEMGNPLGMRALEPEDKSDLSNRSEQRYVTGKAKDVTEALCQIVFPAIDLERPADGTRYDDTAFLDLQSYLGLTGTAANQGSRIFDEETTRENGGPDSDTHLHYIKQLEAIGTMIWAAERYYSIDRHVDVAIDITYIAYYGDRDEFQMSTGSPPSKSYSWCYKMATVSIVGEEVKFTLGMRPLRGYIPRRVLVEQLLEIASDHVSIGTVYADAEFDGVGVIHAVEEAGFSYFIRKSSDDPVKRFVRDMDHDISVKQDHEMEGTVPGGTATVTPTLVGVPSTRKEDETVTFVTNLAVSDATKKARGRTRRVMRRYARRWGIENSYKSIKDFLAWTTSRNTAVRVFYFGFAVILYDMWLLVDLLVQVSLEIDQRLKPRVPPRTFLNTVRKKVPVT
ncbi:transposase [Natronorubrum sp. JWXQ-INN-674]|uniref:Transposase n=1 Tax=Natronorubrum halalkaliphilum TaxID=2691917 RepID=A0A6B0VJ39_9EURY|nr:transposase [Natronorubrum halalkaliphilum]MXV61871.1 transposase [Natronorubrum halalkaliphilum]